MARVASEDNANAGLPSGVIDRLKAYAERVGKKLSEVIDEFITMCKEYSADPTSEEDLLIDWAEQLVVETRRASGGGNSKLQTWMDASRCG